MFNIYFGSYRLIEQLGLNQKKSFFNENENGHNF